MSEPILNYFAPLEEDEDHLRCTLCNRNLKIDRWYSNLKKHLKRVHGAVNDEFELMVEAEKEKEEAIEKAQRDNILLKSQAEFAKFNGDVSLDDIKPTFAVAGPSGSSVCPQCNGTFEDLKAHLPTCQQKTLL